MIEIQQIVNTISHALNNQNLQKEDLILDVFILGVLSKQSMWQNLDQLTHHLDLIVKLRSQTSLQILSRDRVFKFYDDYFKNNQDINELYQQLQKEVYDQSENHKAQIFQIEQKENQIKQQQSQQNQEQFKISIQNKKEQCQQKKSNQQYDNQRNQEYDDAHDYEIALQLQRQFQDEIDQLQQAYQFEDQNDDKNIQCSICLDKIDVNQLIILNCSHQFHHMCINQHCLTQIQQRSLPINCPILECKENIIHPDLKYILDDLSLAKYEEFQFKQYIDTHGDEYSWCPTPDCKYVFIAENERFDCPLCLKSYCLKCKTDFHFNLTCLNYQNSQQRQFLNKSFNSFNQKNHYQTFQQQNPIPLINLQQVPGSGQNQFHQFHKNQQTQFTNNQDNRFQLINPNVQLKLSQNQQQQQFPWINQTLNQTLKFQQQTNKFNNNYQRNYNQNLQQNQFPLFQQCMQPPIQNIKQDIPFNNQFNSSDKSQNINQKQDEFLNLMMISKCKQCPQCKAWVEKISGCNHMTCRCKFQFCYACGGVYRKCACNLY